MNAPNRSYAVDVREIEQMLRADAERLFWELMPNAQRDGHFLCVGSIAGERGMSLKFNISGPNRGMWNDFAGCGGEDDRGDCLHLIRLVLFDGDMTDAIKWAKSWLGIDHLDPARLETRRREASAAADQARAKDEAQRQLKRKRAKSLFLSGRPIAGTPAEAYLRGRGLDAEALGGWPGSLRFHAEVWNTELQHKIPAMLACMVTPEGEHIATHRTYLRSCPQRGWVKIDSPNAKMVLGSCGGSFIPLRKGASGKSMSQMPVGEVIHISEGIEDALTVAMAKPDLRILAGYSLGNIGSILWPKAIGSLTLLADRDTKQKAIDALEQVIARQQARGVRVRISLPPVGFKDFNEWLTSAAVAAAAGGMR